MDAKELNAVVHDHEAAFYDDRFGIDYARIGAIVRRDLARVLGRVPSARRALDVACGTGYVAAGLAIADIANNVHGTDLSIEMLARTRENTEHIGCSVALTLADGERLPYESGSFDLVVARGALHHLPDPLEALREIRRVLELGGTALLLVEPTTNGERQVAAVIGTLAKLVERWRAFRGAERDSEKHTWEMASIAANLHTFEPSDIEALAEKAGFEDIAVQTSSWAWVLMLGLNYYLVGEFEALAESRLAKAAARALIEGADTFDRFIADRIVPSSWRHVVHAVLR